MKIDNNEKYQVSGALINKLLSDARKATLRQVELADIRLVKNCSTSDDVGLSGQLVCDIERNTRCKDSSPNYKDGKCHNCGGQAN